MYDDTNDEIDWVVRRKLAVRRRQLREEVVRYKGGKCEICGYDRCLSALEFHHPDPMDKEFNISDRIMSLTLIKAEVDKCHLLCANCHREVHEGYHPAYLTEGASLEGFDIEMPDNGPSYEEELEMDEIVQNLEETSEQRLRSERPKRNKRHASLRGNQKGSAGGVPQVQEVRADGSGN